MHVCVFVVRGDVSGKQSASGRPWLRGLCSHFSPSLFPQVALTFAEDKVGGHVEGLDLDVVHGHGDALLVVAGDEGERLLRQAHEGASGGGDQGRQAVGAGGVPPSWRWREEMSHGRGVCLCVCVFMWMNGICVIEGDLRFVFQCEMEH